MKHNPVSASVKAALMMDRLERAVVKEAAYTFGGPAPAPEVNVSPSPLAVFELDDAAREAALVLPRKQAHRDLARLLQQDLDRELAVAIGRALGVPAPNPNDREALQALLAEHEFECYIEDDKPERGEVFALDGVPVLWVGEVTMQDDGEKVSVNRAVRHLLPETNKE